MEMNLYPQLFIAHILQRYSHKLLTTLLALTMCVVALADKPLTNLSFYTVASLSAETFQDSSVFNFDGVIDSKKVELTWTTGLEKDLSHFIIQRSINGRDYKDVGIVFTGDNSKFNNNYFFNDAVNTDAKGIIYYRLCLVGLSGKFQNSIVKMIHVGEVAAQVKVQTFPNPVANELRITVPANWQSKKVSYEVYNASGAMVIKVVNNFASETEVITLKNVNSGNYIVKVHSQQGIAIQSIVKN